MTLYLVRHGRAATGVNDLDPGLDDLGHEQAAAVAKALLRRSAARLAVSPLRRTRETAEPIAWALGLHAELCSEVSEVFDPSMPLDQRRTMIGPFMAGRWSEQPEHLRAWRSRVADRLRELACAAEDSGGDVVVVSHYIAISVAIGEGLGDDRVVPVPMANASITTVAIEDGRFRLIEACSTAHLAPEQVTGIHTAIAGHG